MQLNSLAAKTIVMMNENLRRKQRRWKEYARIERDELMKAVIRQIGNH